MSKGRSVSEIQALLDKTGFTRLGENRLEEAKLKLPYFKECEKHYLGKLQSRKIPEIVALFDVIQTVESLKQATLISKQEKEIKVFLQVNLDGSPERSGCKPSEASELIGKIQKLPFLKLIGVMGMASQGPKLAREQFKSLKALQAELSECSMGMSSDYHLAIEEGATMLRLGRCLFENKELALPNGIELE